jgi:methionyl-tRNA formyltransferase
MKVVFFGTPEFAVPTLRRLVDCPRHEVVWVVSRPDKPVGRQREIVSPPVIVEAKRHRLATRQPKKLKTSSFAEAFADTGCDVAVVVAYGRLIPPQLLEMPRYGFVNLHPSLLPRHRGPSPIQWALVCGDRRTGVSTMLIDEGMDTGPVLLQEAVEIGRDEMADELAERLSVAGADLVVRTLDGLAAGDVEPRPQPNDGANVTPMLRRNFGRVDWSMPARQLVNRLRGFTPWPGVFTKLRGGNLKIFGLEEALPQPRGDEKPGTVIATGVEGITVRCGRGTAVRITELQREGRRRMPADAFLIGEQVARGEQLG